jgi:hypothetical protein
VNRTIGTSEITPGHTAQPDVMLDTPASCTLQDKVIEWNQPRATGDPSTIRRSSGSV